MSKDPDDAIARAKANHELARTRQTEMDRARAYRDAAIVEAARLGVTAYRISKELGLSTQAVDYILKRDKNDHRPGRAQAGS